MVKITSVQTKITGNSTVTRTQGAAAVKPRNRAVPVVKNSKGRQKRWCSMWNVRRTWQTLLLVLALSLQLVASDEVVPEVDAVYRRQSGSHQCGYRNMLQDGFKYNYREGRCRSSYDCEYVGMDPVCPEDVWDVVTIRPREKGFYMTPGTDYTNDFRAGLFGWCCKEESGGPIMDICDPTTTSLCDCYAIATRTEKCRTADDKIVEPHDCIFSLTNGKELGLGCSVAWSTDYGRCRIGEKETTSTTCSAMKNVKDCNRLSPCCIYGRTCVSTAFSEETTIDSCKIPKYRTWSQKELENVAAQTCPSAGKKLDANMIKGTVCLKSNNYEATDCWNKGSHPPVFCRSAPCLVWRIVYSICTCVHP